MIDATGAVLATTGYDLALGTTPMTFPGFAGTAVAIRVGDYVVAPDGATDAPPAVVPLRAPITLLGGSSDRATAELTFSMIRS